MFDLSLNESGDIELDSAMTFPDFKLRFMLSDYGSQRITFLSAPQKIAEKDPAPQSVSFMYTKNLKSIQLHPNPIEDDDEALQAIIIELRTENTDTYNFDVGSHLFRHRHTIYTSDDSLDEVKNLILGVIQKYMPEAKVSIAFADDDAAGFFFCQALRVKIRNFDNIYVFDI